MIVTGWHHLKEIAALHVADTKIARANALLALERFVATGSGMKYAATNALNCRVSHRKALRALEALTRCP